jgi:hypothetical protein
MKPLCVPKAPQNVPKAPQNVPKAPQTTLKYTHKIPKVHILMLEFVLKVHGQINMRNPRTVSSAGDVTNH